jgi:hypothetical protein
MNMDEWTTRLSEYIDGDLDSASTLLLEQHLAGCDHCRTIVHELRTVVDRAAALTDSRPGRDLWNGIAAVMAADVHPQQPMQQPMQLRPRRGGRSLTLSMPQLAAAATVLLVLGAAATWQLRPRLDAGHAVADRGAPATTPSAAPDGSTTDASDRGAASALTVADAPDDRSADRSPDRSADRSSADRDPGRSADYSADGNAATVGRGIVTVSNPIDASVPHAAGYDAAIREMEEAAALNDGQIDPRTRQVILQSIATIDRAIADARAALERDPASAYLQRHLDSTMKQKLELLQQAANVRRRGA